MNCTLTLSSETSLYIYNRGSNLFYTVLPFTRTPQIRHIHRGFLGDFHACIYKDSPVFLFKTTDNRVVLLYNLNTASSIAEITLLETKEDGDEFRNFHLTAMQDRVFFFYTIYSPIDDNHRLYYHLPFEQVRTAIYDFNSGLEIKTDENKEITLLNQRIEHITKQYNELYEYTKELQQVAKRMNSMLAEGD